MAICHGARPPDLFVTTTCNPKWPEIQRDVENYIPGQPIVDRPDTIARVFKMKLDDLMDDIHKGNHFGRVKTGYEMHYRSVAVERLPFHEEGCNRVYFRGDDDVDNVIQRETATMSKFTEWMKAKEMYLELGSTLKLDNPNADNQVFGKKVVVLGGDFRQILLVIPNASRAVVVSSTVAFYELLSDPGMKRKTQDPIGSHGRSRWSRGTRRHDFSHFV
ncbi:putative AT hook motif-containing protein [Tanacetum coccineum]